MYYVLGPSKIQIPSYSFLLSKFSFSNGIFSSNETVHESPQVRQIKEKLILKILLLKKRSFFLPLSLPWSPGNSWNSLKGTFLSDGSFSLSLGGGAVFLQQNVTFISWVLTMQVHSKRFLFSKWILWRNFFFLIHTNKSCKWQIFPFPKLSSKISYKLHIGNNYDMRSYFLFKLFRRQNLSYSSRFTGIPLVFFFLVSRKMFLINKILNLVSY